MDHYSSQQLLSQLLIIQSAVGITFDSRNAATASKPNVVCVIAVLK